MTTTRPGSRPDTTIFVLAAEDLEEAAEGAIRHLQEIVAQESRRGFTAPKLLGEYFELVEGSWRHCFRFSAEILPAET